MRSRDEKENQPCGEALPVGMARLDRLGVRGKAGKPNTYSS
jgi:hypothetical protein